MHPQECRPADVNARLLCHWLDRRGMQAIAHCRLSLHGSASFTCEFRIMKKNILLSLMAGCCLCLHLPARGADGKDYEKEFPLSRHVDPRIGSEGLGRVFIGPSCPFGMVKPSPDCTPSPNSGWLPMPERVDGFAQVHVSGTGGGPKYGNVLVTPFSGAADRTQHLDYREYENIRLGYYDTRFQGSGIRTEITTAEY